MISSCTDGCTYLSVAYLPKGGVDSTRLEIPPNAIAFARDVAMNKNEHIKNKNYDKSNRPLWTPGRPGSF